MGADPNRKNNMRQYLGKKRKTKPLERKELRLHTDYLTGIVGVIILFPTGLLLLLLPLDLWMNGKTLIRENCLEYCLFCLVGLFLLNIGLKLLYSVGDYIDIRKEGIELRLSKSIWCWEVPHKAFFAWEELEGYYTTTGRGGRLWLKLRGEARPRRYEISYLWSGWSSPGSKVETALLPYLGNKDKGLT